MTTAVDQGDTSEPAGAETAAERELRLAQMQASADERYAKHAARLRKDRLMPAALKRQLLDRTRVGTQQIASIYKVSASWVSQSRENAAVAADSWRADRPPLRQPHPSLIPPPVGVYSVSYGKEDPAQELWEVLKRGLGSQKLRWNSTLQTIESNPNKPRIGPPRRRIVPRIRPRQKDRG